MSQFQCGRSASQHGYPSSAWCAVTVTNYLMGREPSLKRISPLTPLRCRSVVLRGISIDFSMLSPSSGPVAHALLTRPPLSLNVCPKTLVQAPFDLHVLSAPPAFVLSQDQTLNLEFDSSSTTFPFPGRSFACVFSCFSSGIDCFSFALPLTLSCQYNAPFVSSTVQFSRISPAARILAGNRRYVTTNAATLSTLFSPVFQSFFSVFRFSERAILFYKNEDVIQYMFLRIFRLNICYILNLVYVLYKNVRVF